MKAPSKKLFYKANKKPVGLGRAAEIKENHRNREVRVVRVKSGRFGDTYNVYVRRKGK